MNKETISDKQAISLILLFLLGTASIITIGTEAGKDMWISIIIAVLTCIIFTYIYSQFNSTFHGSDLFDILEYCFGKVIGKIFISLYIWYALFSSSLILSSLSGLYFATVSPETPVTVINIFAIIFIAMGLKQGIETLGRFSEFFILIVVAFAFMAIFMLIPAMEVNNILPILSEGIKPVLSGAFSAFSFPFAEIVIFTMVFSALKERRTVKKVYFLGIIITGTMMIIISIVNLMVIGSEIASIYYFPTFLTFSKINIGNFFERIEILVSFIYVIGGFVKLSIYVLAISIGMCRLFNCKEYRVIVIPVLLLILNLSSFLFEGQAERSQWSRDIWKFFAFPFQVIIPVLTFIILKIKLKAGKKKISS